MMVFWIKVVGCKEKGLNRRGIIEKVFWVFEFKCTDPQWKMKAKEKVNKNWSNTAGPKRPVSREQNSNAISYLALQKQFAGTAFDTIQLLTCHTKRATTDEAKTVVDDSYVPGCSSERWCGKGSHKLGEWLQASDGIVPKLVQKNEVCRIKWIMQVIQ